MQKNRHAIQSQYYSINNRTYINIINRNIRQNEMKRIGIAIKSMMANSSLYKKKIQSA